MVYNLEHAYPWTEESDKLGIPTNNTDFEKKYSYKIKIKLK